MYIIIVGGGLIGKGLTKALVEAKHDVTVIDKDSEICEEIYANYGAISINGDATKLNTLKNAHISKADVAIGVTPDDSVNLAFAILAKHFKIPEIMVRMSDPAYEDVYKFVGVTNIARATQLLIDQFIVNIESPELRKVINIGDLVIDIINMPENSIFDNKKLIDMVKTKGFPENVTITAIYKETDKKFIAPRGDDIINSKDRIFMCGNPKDIKKAAKIIVKSGK
jgi:trk system potassium uptake protein TrkA